MKASMLRDLSDVFSLKAAERDDEDDIEEAKRLWGIADELSEKSKKARKTVKK